MEREIPNRLYKYRAFSDLTVQTLVSDELFFADPSTFNDPLDTQPCVKQDVSQEVLDMLLEKLQRQRQDNGDEIDNDLERRNPRKKYFEIEGRSTSSDEAVDRASQAVCIEDIEIELIRKYKEAFFCLSERADSSLMWSHYGDHHKGVCLGYSVSKAAKNDIYPVNYEQDDREVKASDVAAMLAGDSTAKQRVNDAVLLRKAHDWAYEQEWRLIGKQGKRKSPLELKEIIFGLRCSQEVKVLIVNMMKGRLSQDNFYEMKEKGSSFLLEKCKVNLEELEKFPIFNHYESVDLQATSNLEADDKLSRKG